MWQIIIKLAKTTFGFIVGNKAKTIAYIVMFSIVGTYIYWQVDSSLFKPIRVAKEATKQCYIDKNNNEEVLHEVISQAGEVISEQGQKIYDINNSIRPMMVECDRKLIECETDKEYFRWEVQHEKNNLDDEYFYINYSF